MIELYQRLAGAGDPVTFGSAVPSTTRLLVLYKPSIESPALHARALSVLRRNRASYALIRGDATGRFPLPVAPVRGFVPIAALVTSEEHRWLPPLPQRGLLPRRLERRGRVRSLAFKGNPENVPPYMRDESWRAALAERGINWHLDTPRLTDGSDQQWHDFSEVDAVACVRNAEMSWDIERKPATRLINAWRAGGIPLADDEPGYGELGKDGHESSSCVTVPSVSRFSIACSRIRRSSHASRSRSDVACPSSHPRSSSRTGVRRYSKRSTRPTPEDGGLEHGR
jgi:hypothetical protein